MRKTRIWLGCSALLFSMPAGQGEEAVDLLEGKAVELKVEVPAFPAAQAAAQKEKEEKEAEKLGANLLPEAVRKDFDVFTSKVAAQRRPGFRPRDLARGPARLATTLALVGVSLLPWALGFATVWSGAAAVIGGVWFIWRAIVFLRPVGRDVAARKLFLCSIAYLPLVLGALVADRIINF